MNCGLSLRNGVAVVAPTGRLDAASAHDFRDALLQAARSAEGEIVLDFSAVTELASAALIVLAAALPDILATSRCRVVGASARIQRTFSLTALDQVVEVEVLPPDECVAAETSGSQSLRPAP